MQNSRQSPDSIPLSFIGGAIAVIIALFLLLFSFKIVSPGYVGVKVTMGSISAQPIGAGFRPKLPFFTSVEEVSIMQETKETLAPCFSSDLQQINMKVKVLYRRPTDQVVNLYQNYQGDIFDSLVAPRVQEALKEVTAGSTAEQIVKTREKIKQSTLESARLKIGAILQVDDIVIENIDLTPELEKAIEAKMVQEQMAGQSKFKQDQAKIDAETKIITAKADAESIKIQGEALKETPGLVQLKIVEKWDGKAPMVVSAGNGANPASIVLPMPTPNSLDK